MPFAACWNSSQARGKGREKKEKEEEGEEDFPAHFQYQYLLLPYFLSLLFHLCNVEEEKRKASIASRVGFDVARIIQMRQEIHASGEEGGKGKEMAPHLDTVGFIFLPGLAQPREKKKRGGTRPNSCLACLNSRPSRAQGEGGKKKKKAEPVEAECRAR